jgi:hypothetical protein
MSRARNSFAEGGVGRHVWGQVAVQMVVVVAVLTAGPPRLQCPG